MRIDEWRVARTEWRIQPNQFAQSARSARSASGVREEAQNPDKDQIESDNIV
jgi:hypothetical protein